MVAGVALWENVAANMTAGIVLILIGGKLYRYAISMKENSFPKAKEQAEQHLDSAILVDEYCEKYGVDREQVDALVRSGGLAAYAYDGILFVEDIRRGENDV